MTTTIPAEMLGALLGNAKTQNDLFGQDDLLKQLSKQLMERLLDMEMTNHGLYKTRC